MPRLAALSSYVVERLGALPGITSLRTHLVVESFSGADLWRLRSLNSAQQGALRRRLQRPASTPRGLVPSNQERLIIRELSHDGRLSYRALAARTGLPEARLRRSLTQLLASGTRPAAYRGRTVDLRMAVHGGALGVGTSATPAFRGPLGRDDP